MKRRTAPTHRRSSNRYAHAPKASARWERALRLRNRSALAIFQSAPLVGPPPSFAGATGRGSRMGESLASARRSSSSLAGDRRKGRGSSSSLGVGERRSLDLRMAVSTRRERSTSRLLDSRRYVAVLLKRCQMCRAEASLRSRYGSRSASFCLRSLCATCIRRTCDENPILSRNPPGDVGAAPAPEAAAAAPGVGETVRLAGGK